MSPFQNHTDLELVNALQQGEEKAFAEIFQRYAKKLYAYTRKSIAVKEDCQEIVQDAFESLWQKRGKLWDDTKLDAYLYRVVKYKIIRYVSHKKVIQKYSDHFKAFEVAYDDNGDEKELESLRSLLDTSLSKLPERCQMVVRLRIDENLSNGAIAERMNIDKDSVKRYMTHAMSYFKEQHPPLYKAK